MIPDKKNTLQSREIKEDELMKKYLVSMIVLGMMLVGSITFAGGGNEGTRPGLNRTMTIDLNTALK